MSQSFRNKADAAFPEARKEDWKEKLIIDLKGKSPDNILEKTSTSGFDFETYRDSSGESLPVSKSLRNIIGDKYQHFGVARFWYNRMPFTVKNEKEDNALILNLLENGVNGVSLYTEDGNQEIDFKSLLKDINTEYCDISIADDGTLELTQNYFSFIEKEQSLSKIKGTVLTSDPNFLFEASGAYEKIIYKNQSEDFKTINLPATYFHNQGFSPVEEIAWTLSLIVDVIDQYDEIGISPYTVLKNMEVTTSAGAKYFEEIAKVRSLRYLVSKVAEAYRIQGWKNQSLNVHASSSDFYRSLKDEQNNMLRNTSSAISGLLGGADSITVFPHDNTFAEYTEFSTRIAKNISCLLADESHFNKVNDPVSGSYLIEYLTDSTAQQAWKKFVELENAGGFLKLSENGTLKDLIHSKKVLWRDRLKDKEEILIGVNQYESDKTVSDEKWHRFKKSDSVVNYIEQ